MLLKTYPAEIPLKNAVVAISPDGRTVAVGGISGAKISFFDLAGVEWMRTVTIGIPPVGEYFNVTGMEYLPDGTLIVTSDGPYAIYHMDMNGNVLSTWEGIGFALSADKKILAHSSTEGVTLVEIASNTPLYTLEDWDALDSSFSPDGSMFATADVGVDYLNTVIWDIEKQTSLTTLTGMSNPRFSPDGKFLAVINWDLDDSNPLQIFSADGTNQVAILRASAPAHLNGTEPLWSADGSLIAAQVAKGSPIAWEAETWQPLDGPEFQGELDSFSPDGRMLITRTDDGAILLWGVVQARG
jgi:WD40 repeat protein